MTPKANHRILYEVSTPPVVCGERERERERLTKAIRYRITEFHRMLHIILLAT